MLGTIQGAMVRAVPPASIVWPSGSRAHHRVSGDRAVRTAAVFRNDRLAELGCERLEHCPGHQISGASGREGNVGAQRLSGPGLRRLASTQPTPPRSPVQCGICTSSYHPPYGGMPAAWHHSVLPPNSLGKFNCNPAGASLRAADLVSTGLQRAARRLPKPHQGRPLDGLMAGSGRNRWWRPE